MAVMSDTGSVWKKAFILNGVIKNTHSIYNEVSKATTSTLKLSSNIIYKAPNTDSTVLCLTVM